MKIMDVTSLTINVLEQNFNDHERKSKLKVVMTKSLL